MRVRAVATLRTAASVIALLALLAGSPMIALAQGTRVEPAAGESGASIPPAAGSLAAAPAPPPRDPLAEVRANFTPEAHSYWMTRTALEILSPLYTIAIGLLMLFSGWSRRIRDFANRKFSNRYGRMLVYFSVYSAIGFILSLPRSVYAGFVVEHSYGLSTQSFPGWLGEEIMGLIVTVVLLGGTGLLALAYRAIEKSPRRWSLWLAAGSVPLIVIAVLIEPIALDPLFNEFTPLKDPQLKTQLLDLAAKTGIPGRNVYEVDKSAQTKKYNAYVKGFGASQRIVLWDTTLKGLEPDEILFVMGHEMGHYQLGHIWRGLAFYSLLSVALLYLGGALVAWGIRRFGERWGIREVNDIATLPLFVVALSVVMLIAQPAVNAYSRATEHEADVFALEVTRLNDAGVRAFVKLASQNKANPEPPLALKWFEYDHPPVIERMQFAIDHHPWSEGKPNVVFRQVE